MSVGPLVTEVVLTFCLAAGLLYRYGNWFRHHLFVTISVLVAWYFSFLIVFVLPIDVSSTVFHQCVREHIIKNLTPSSLDSNSLLNGSSKLVVRHLLSNLTEADNMSTVVPAPSVTPPPWECKEPWSHVEDAVLLNLWRVVYWTSQVLTWLIMPMMQSYTQAGDFTVKGKLKAALVDNAIYYGSYLFICGILLIYIAVKPGLNLDWSKLKAIAASASNTWGLFLLILLLGYGLVEIPRSLWNASKRGYRLNYAYFKVAKLSAERAESEEVVDDVLEALQAASLTVSVGHPFREYLETILQKVPVEMRERMSRRQLPDDTPMDSPTEKMLTRLHKQVIRALQTHHRTETQWSTLVESVFDMEDIARNQASHEKRFKPSFQPNRPDWLQVVYTPTVEWYWKCVVNGFVFRVLAVLAGLLSAAVVWSEVTFFSQNPVLSIFALLLELATIPYDYFTIEIVSCISIAYLCVCAYSTLFKVRVLNYYYLSPHHQTDEYSLIFSGMMLCRLTPPMCLNFLGLIHMDSHITKQKGIVETQYTQVMGHMDVISIISDGFNIYFPMLVLALCLATYFSVGSRLLSLIGFQQFVGDDEVTSDLVDEGRELIKREKRRRQRAEDSSSRRREFRERFGSGTMYRSSRQRAEDRGRTDYASSNAVSDASSSNDHMPEC